MTDTASATATHSPDRAATVKAIDKRSFATLATVSPAGRPHVAGVLYQRAGDELYFSTHAASRKARNIAGNRHVGVCIPIRRLPVGPPASVHFQATAEILADDDAAFRRLVDDGSLDSITGHGELEAPGVCFVRITLPARANTYGLGMSIRQLLRAPLDAAGRVTLSA
jgi:general stress protein 26